ncbi:hypothetical protein ES332_D12G097800v1 [Gossypium tomentosum]|uniref:Uncharacterized protein n=1 Tax=Gossypium tomentosum TaxID=34277 RepID=A0A5D2I6Q1_GOSTO|nr:hypothetical protein ES332_D12G097800v1 [Gossypium tomentosum]
MSHLLHFGSRFIYSIKYYPIPFFLHMAIFSLEIFSIYPPGSSAGSSVPLLPVFVVRSTPF